MSNESVLPESERDKTLPPRFRSSAFRRYEAVLKQTVDNHPNEVEVDPTKFGLSLCTVEQRLRDAKTSYYKHNWSSTIDREKFEKVRDDLEVRCDNGKIYIGPKPPAENDRVVLGNYRIDLPKNKEPLVFDMPMANSYEVVCLLAANRALSRPLKLAIADSLADSLYSSFDINLEKQPDGSYILT